MRFTLPTTLALVTTSPVWPLATASVWFQRTTATTSTPTIHGNDSRADGSRSPRGWNLAIDLYLLVVLDQSSAGIDDAGTFNGMRMSFLNGDALSGDAQLAYTVDHNAHMKLLVFDPAGRNIVDNDMGAQSAGQHQTALNSGNWGAGTYIVSLVADRRTLTKKFVKF